MSWNDLIVDIRLLCRRQFATSILMMMMVGATLFSTTQLMLELPQESFGYTATLSGLVLMPGGISMFLMMPIATLLTNFVIWRSEPDTSSRNAVRSPPISPPQPRGVRAFCGTPIGRGKPTLARREWTALLSPRSKPQGWMSGWPHRD
jgi:hypothetical protein